MNVFVRGYNAITGLFPFLAVDALGAASVSVQNYASITWPADRHEDNGGIGANAADVHFTTTDSTNFNEHIFEVVTGAATLTVKANSGSAFRNVFVEDMASATPGTPLTGVGLPIGIYRLKGNFSSIKSVQSGAAASSVTLTSYVKG